MSYRIVNLNQSFVSTALFAFNRLRLKPIDAFRIRVEAGEGGGVSETAAEEDVVTEGSDEESETGEEEVKAVRTPRVKLGDVMGVRG